MFPLQNLAHKGLNYKNAYSIKSIPEAVLFAWT